jgi:CheY-like chemotaxis protein/anti-sigma regulatory factor (Ser/Thr protein kinase)
MDTVDVHLLVRAAVDICKREESAKLVTELEATRHHVYGDATRVQQIIWNLVNNAQKFTPRNGTILVKTMNAAEGRIRIEVRDTGIGIEPGVLPRLFSAFEQGDVRAMRQHAGLGLGLAISKKLVEAHGGTITAMSDGHGKGATFAVELSTVAVFEPAPVAHAPARDTGNERMLRVLLVEDHEATLRILARLLGQLGHKVTEAATVAQAMAAAERSRFDLLLSDIGLPDGNGLDLLRRVKAHQPIRGIALTGYGMEEDVRRSRDAGFEQHLTKPVDFQRLHAAITQVMT